MGVGVLDLLGIETDLSFGIIGVGQLTYELGIDAQEIIHIRLMDVLLNAFLQGHGDVTRLFGSAWSTPDSFMS